MARRRKYDLPPPEPMTVPPSPAEIIELQPKGGARPGTPVQLVPVGPPPEIIEASPAPRVELVVVLRFPRPAPEAAAAALDAARFVAAVQEVDRKLRLALDAARSVASGEEITLVLVPALHGVETAARLGKVAAAVPQAAAAFAGAVLGRVEVVPRP